MDKHRPDPDALLAAIQKDDVRQRRGKLKILLGMAAGVGKTYAMLQAAHQQKTDGVDVVVGYVETHKRPETEALLDGLEIFPRRRYEYHETVFLEMDPDAILDRRPQLVLVDELAHTNAAGARHHKRYQDIIELLEAGIDVWTTVNVQHFESRADVVRQITGIAVHETVPDSLLDLADEVELIDFSPENLRKRLSEGKVDSQERIEFAAKNFFRVGNLTALREIALRLTAEHVDHKLQDYMQLKQIDGPWKSTERLMVAVGPSPFSEHLIRWTRRMAYSLEVPWLAVHIETTTELSPKAKTRLVRNIALARSLGAEIVAAEGEDVPLTLLQVARQRNVTQIVVGKPQHPRWQTLIRRSSMVDRIIRNSGDIDIYVITGEKKELASKASHVLLLAETHSNALQYPLTLMIVGLVTLMDFVLFRSLPWVGYLTVGLTQLLTVLLVAAYVGRGPALLAATVSAISWNFLFIEPRFTFTIGQFHDVVLFFLYFTIAIFTGNLTARLRTQERQARYNADRAMALYTLAHETAIARNLDNLLQTAIKQINHVLNAQVTIILPKGGELEAQPHASSTGELDKKDHHVAQWVYGHGKPAGRFTNTLSEAAAQYHPLLTPTRRVGVIGIRTQQNEPLSIDQQQLFETIISQVSLLIEREMLEEVARQSAVLRESERVYTTLLNSISHELRTPIATIKGAASSLLDPPTGFSEHTRIELMNDIQNAADRLNRLVENLLDMSRLESGKLPLKRDWCDVNDILGVTIKRVEYCSSDHPISIKNEPNLPLIQVDFGLIEQALVNLLDNACHYTPSGTPIEIEVRKWENHLEIIVTDSGPGIPEGFIERIFDKFYRLSGTAPGGTGLGLSISRGLIEAHGGVLEAENVVEGGVRFIVRLPIDDTPPPVQEATHV